METKDPALSKTRITETDNHQTLGEAQTMNTHPDNHDELEENITENKGTDTFEEGIVDSEHVNDDDNPARQPDRRDQKGNGFDDNINEKTVGSESPDSQKINDMNRYANIDNAQTRVLNPDEKDSIR
ncbi:hypothetical protein [Psychrobacter namhaensis]|uniref:hypothetical protein n=1 Tax=Psychrobacter namhaensis TaxID=292734 RepID=UPI003D0660C1